MLLKKALICRFIAILLFAYYPLSCQQETQININRQKSDKIIFLSNRDAPKREFDIFSMDLDGSHQTNLTKDLKGVRTFSNPVISHDKKLVLFLVFYTTKRTLYVLNLTDSSSTPLTEVSHDKPEPRFSPDDQSIVFTDKVNSKNQIFKIGLNGKNRENLSNNNFSDSEPEFSSNGKLICYTSKRGKKSAIGVMNTDGSNQENITKLGYTDNSPSFSPDGSKVLFSSNRFGNFDIYTVQIKNKRISTIYENKSQDVEPQYSPKGDRVAFISNLRGMQYKDIIVIDIKSKDVVNLTAELQHFNRYPVFTPDDKSIVFEAVGAMNSDVYQIDIDGKNLKNLTNHQKWDLAPTL